ncbi:hypothetical protein [Sphingomonas koreensis]
MSLNIAGFISRFFGAQLVANGLDKAKNIPSNGNTAVRLVVRNRRSKLTGLTARLIKVEPQLEGWDGQFHLPLSLATKAQLDVFRSGIEPRPNLPFDLNAGAEEHIEICWLGTQGALEGVVAHQAGDTMFLVAPGYIFHIELSGEIRPVTYKVHLLVLDDETGRWDCEIVK